MIHKDTHLTHQCILSISDRPPAVSEVLVSDHQETPAVGDSLFGGESAFKRWSVTGNGSQFAEGTSSTKSARIIEQGAVIHHHGGSMVLVWLPQEVQKEELKDRKEIKELNEVKLKELKELRKKKLREELRKEWQVKKMMEVQDSDHDDENTAALSEV
ncbi:hypothetical protein BGX29_012271 [Mortierella sp. GBA35]|nr:hypothetical protein BGX29_012271 [Mortierella sp. GBA35]